MMSTTKIEVSYFARATATNAGIWHKDRKGEEVTVFAGDWTGPGGTTMLAWGEFGRKHFGSAEEAFKEVRSLPREMYSFEDVRDIKIFKEVKRIITEISEVQLP